MKRSRLEIVSEKGHYAVVKLYANELNGSYGDIYQNLTEVKLYHPTSTIMQGYGIIDLETGYCPTEVADWYETLEATEQGMQAILEEKILQRLNEDVEFIDCEDGVESELIVAIEAEIGNNKKTVGSVDDLSKAVPYSKAFNAIMNLFNQYEDINRIAYEIYCSNCHQWVQGENDREITLQEALSM